MATYGITENTANEELTQLVAQDNPIMTEITLKANCGAIARGTVLEMVSIGGGLYQQLQAANGANARAILAETVANDAANTQKVQAYFVGKYKESDMIWPDGITTQQKRTAIVGLQDRGIVIDRGILAVPTTTTTTTTSSSTTTTSSSSSSSTTSSSSSTTTSTTSSSTTTTTTA